MRNCSPKFTEKTIDCETNSAPGSEWIPPKSRISGQKLADPIGSAESLEFLRLVWERRKESGDGRISFLSVIHKEGRPTDDKNNVFGPKSEFLDDKMTPMDDNVTCWTRKSNISWSTQSGVGWGNGHGWKYSRSWMRKTTENTKKHPWTKQGRRAIACYFLFLLFCFNIKFFKIISRGF